MVTLMDVITKIVSMIRKMQTNLWHHEEEPHNNHQTEGRQPKQNLPHQDDCKTRVDIK